MSDASTFLPPKNWLKLARWAGASGMLVLPAGMA